MMCLCDYEAPARPTEKRAVMLHKPTGLRYFVEWEVSGVGTELHDTFGKATYRSAADLANAEVWERLA